MKKRISFLLLFATFVLLAKAQSTFYAVTPGNGNGVISKYNPTSNSLTAVYTFQNTGFDPYGSEFTESNGKLYGTTTLGGAFNKGVFFSFDPSTNSYTKLYDLTAPCTGVLVNGQGSIIYGLTRDYVFSFNTSTSSFVIRYNFTAEQKWPIDGLTLGADGKFYGLTKSLIFSFDTVTNTYTKLLDLDPLQGGVECGLTLGVDNNFYFNTIGGDVNYSGIIYRFNPITLSLQNVHNYNGVDGEFPSERMTLANNGKLYGVTTSATSPGSFGVIYSYDPITGIYEKVHDFVYGAGGRFSQALVLGSDSKLYGGSATINYDNGILFSLDPTTNDFTVLHNFENGAPVFNQEAPTGKLIIASNGKFYGMLANEFQSNGKIFSYDISGDNLTLLFGFQNLNGFQPNGSLVLGSNGLFYGTTTNGGMHDLGVIFSFNPANNTYTKRYDFDSANGNGHFANTVLIALGNGKLYGTTAQGGTSNMGVVFSFDPSTNIYSKIYDFTATDGYGGVGLVEANNGLLYSVSANGGQTNVYSVNPVTNTHTILYSMGNTSVGKFVKTPNGKLYAMGLGGDYGYGVIFSFDPQTNIGARVYSFDGTKGRYPYGDLFFSSDGELYGMTSEGGANNAGVLFYFDPLPNIVNEVADFDGTNGSKPMGSLMEDEGKLYSMTSAGGTNNHGVVFSYRPSTGTFTKLQDFDGINGGNAQYGSFVKLAATTTKIVKVNIYGGANPYNNPEWNNWNTFASLSSGSLHYSDGSPSTIVATLSQQTSVSDNGTSYTTSVAPQEVTRYASYSTTSRTLVISGLDNSKAYALEIYATRSGASNNTTRFIIQNKIVDIPTGNNLTLKVSYDALGAVSGVIILNISGLTTYNYINGFTLTEMGTGPTNAAPTVDAGSDKSITLPVNSIQMNGSASDTDGFIASYSWVKISGPSQYIISNSADPAATISNLVEGTYVFRLGVYDNQGAFSSDEITITVNPSSPTKYVKVNLYGGLNPYNHPEWNNWNSSSSLSSGVLKYSDGTSSSVSAALSQQTGIADNGAGYNSTMAPPEVVRYASYSTSNRTLIISGLDNSKTYNLEFNASRKGATSNTTRFTIGATSVDILTDNNLSNKASFTSIAPSSGQIAVSISRLNVYNYLNGFILTENAISSPITRRIQSSSELQVLSSSVGVYPNPATDQITLSVNNNYTGQMKVQIIDMRGAVVKAFRLSKNYKGASQNYLLVRDLIRGEYLIRIQTGNNIETKKLLKL